MSKFYTYQAWVDTFQPIANSIRNNGDTAFETYGDEFDFVSKADNKHIWTEVDGDEGTYIVSGYHFVNRIQYYITNKPWTDEMTEVPTWVYRQCDCAELSEDGEYDPECEECDEGMIDIDIDTPEALKAIYGEDNNDIVK